MKRLPPEVLKTIQLDIEAGMMHKSEICRIYDIKIQSLSRLIKKHKWIYGKSKPLIERQAVSVLADPTTPLIIPMSEVTYQLNEETKEILRLQEENIIKAQVQLKKIHLTQVAHYNSKIAECIEKKDKTGANLYHLGLRSLEKSMIIQRLALDMSTDNRSQKIERTGPGQESAEDVLREVAEMKRIAAATDWSKQDRANFDQAASPGEGEEEEGTLSESLQIGNDHENSTNQHSEA